VLLVGLLAGLSVSPIVTSLLGAWALIVIGMVLVDQGGDLHRAEADFQQARQRATDARLKEISDKQLRDVQAKLHPPPGASPPPR